MAHRTALINVMAGAAMKAGRALIRDFGEVEQLQVSRKGPGEFVSVADHKAERIVCDELKRARPAYGILAEERGAETGTDTSNRWIVDPLDGTTNFLHGIPHFSITIALERDRELFAGVVYDQLRDEMFWAENGRGAYMNGRRLRVSARQHLMEAVLATGIPFHGRPGYEVFVAILREMMPRVAGIRRFGSAALDLAYVAAGRYDGFWETGLSAWDVAAGIVLVREAGGFVTEIDGGERMLATGDVLAANPVLHARIREVLMDARRTLEGAREAAPAER